MNPEYGSGGGFLGLTITPWIKRIMITTGVLSVVSAISIMWLGSNFPLHLALHPNSVLGRGDFAPIPAIWQLLTFPYIERNVFGLLITLLMYGWFGGTLESWWGSVRFFKFFFGMTAGVAVATVLLALIWPNLAESRFLGPFPIIASMIIAWGLTFPDRIIRLFLVLPVKGIHMVGISVGITLLMIIFSGAIAPFVPHIIGMTFSALLVTGGWRGRRLRLYYKKWMIEQQIKKEQKARKSRLEKAPHLRVVDPDEDEQDGKDPEDYLSDSGADQKGEDKDRSKKNGDDRGNGSGGWLH